MDPLRTACRAHPDRGAGYARHARSRARHRASARDGAAEELVDFSVAFDRVLLEFLPGIDIAEQAATWTDWFASLTPLDANAARLHELPVTYDGADLAELAERHASRLPKSSPCTARRFTRSRCSGSRRGSPISSDSIRACARRAGRIRVRTSPPARWPLAEATRASTASTAPADGISSARQQRASSTPTGASRTTPRCFCCAPETA